MRTIAHLNPTPEFRTLEEMFDRMFATPVRPSAPVANALPLDVTERDNKLVVRAALPGIDPKDIDIQIEENVLTIRGETRSETESQDEKVYRREITAGKFARSVRLPEDLNLDAVDAEFKNGLVIVTLPRQEAPKPKTLKVNLRAANPEGTSEESAN